MIHEEGHKDEEVYCICRTSDITRFMIACDKCEEWYHGDCIDVTERQAGKIRKFFCQKCRTVNPKLQIVYKESKSHHHDASRQHDESHKHKEKEKHRHSKSKHDKKHLSSKSKSRERCGECEACYQTENCGRCEQCKDMPKYGGAGHLRQRCKKRQCQNFVHMALKSNQKREKQVYIASPPKPLLKPPPQEDFMTVLKDKNEYSDDDVWEPTQPSLKKRHLEKCPPKEPKSKGRPKLSTHTDHSSHRRRKRPPSSSSEFEVVETPVVNRQCFGPQCPRAARPHSKYCCDECGIKLAEARIYSVLPQRIQEWKMSQCVAEQKDTKQLEKIRKQQAAAHEILQGLKRRQMEFEHLVARVKNATVDAHADDDTEEDAADSNFVYCVTCGHEVSVRRAVRHLENCFNKLECQTTFCSIYKTRVEEGVNVFCDTYNAANGTYCKRLRVMCSEHFKDPKIGDDDVCGAPLVSNVFDETGKICLASRKKCLRHFCWEKLHRAEIDMEIVRQWLKLDELMEQERAVRSAMTNRAGVLGLMLHSTYDHHLAEKLHAQQLLHAERPQPPPTSDHMYHMNPQEVAQPAEPHKATEVVTTATMAAKANADHRYSHQQNPVGSAAVKIAHETKLPLADHMYCHDDRRTLPQTTSQGVAKTTARPLPPVKVTLASATPAMTNSRPGTNQGTWPLTNRAKDHQYHSRPQLELLAGKDRPIVVLHKYHTDHQYSASANK